MSSRGASLRATRLRRRLRQRSEGDDGQVLLLTLVYTLIAFSLIIVVVDATAVHLARTQLLDAADGTALDAADGIDASGTYGAADAPPSSTGARVSGSAITTPRVVIRSTPLGQFTSVTLGRLNDGRYSSWNSGRLHR